MTREQLISILQEGGMENPSKLVINSILNVVNDEKRDAVNEAIERTKGDFKGYKSKEDVESLEKQIADLKDAGAKAERVNKMKLKGINEKYIDFADGLLKESKDFDKDLEKYVGNYPEQFKQIQEEKKEKKFEDMGGSKKEKKESGPTSEWNTKFRSAILGSSN